MSVHLDVMADVSLLTALGLIVLGLFAGWLGAVVGIGGGVVIVPVLVLAFGYDIRIAVAASLVAVVATSTAAGSAYVGEGLANMRLGMTLEIATTLGGITGGLVAVLIAPSVISGLFAVMMVITTFLVLRGRDEHGELDGAEEDDADDDLGPEGLKGYELPGRLAGAYYDHHRGGMVTYEAERLGVGSSISFVAGALSGLLGVGGGFLKVPAMNLGMKVPIKVAAATSNFMIGVTAIASLFVYFARGYLHPLLAAPLAVGVVGGALVGAATSAHVSPVVLRRILAVVLLAVSVQMALNAFGVDLGR
jgi:uncharacterized membrane protein YfcA